MNGLGILRNRLGDAHGRGVSRIKPAPRHAELSVNLAGSMAIFLIDTFEAKVPSDPKIKKNVKYKLSNRDNMF